MKASDLLVRAMEAEGVAYVFGVAGEETLDLVESLRNSSIRLIVTRHEQAAGFMAATCGRLTGTPGVCLATLGPGATNLVTAAAYAQLGAMPMVMITGQKPIKSSKQGHFQIVEVVDMMRPLVKYTRQIVSGDSIPARVREAFRIAEEERPGVAHLELPEDIAAEDTSVPIMAASYVRRPIAEIKAIDCAVRLLEGARSPLIVVGAGANRKRTCNMLRQFVDKTSIPFVSTQMGKGVLDERCERFIGNATLSANDFVHRAIDAADVIMNVGHDVVEKPPFFMRPGGRTVIHVNFKSAEVDAVYFPQAEVVGDIANSIWQIKEKLEPQTSWDFSFFEKVRQRALEHAAGHADDDSFPLKPLRLVTDVRKAVPDGGIITMDNGMFKIWFARNYQAHHPNSVLLDNALASMGAGLPSAIASCLVQPDQPVLAICGDGGFMMNSQELETAVRYGLNMTILVLRDDGYGMVKWKQASMGFPDFGLKFGNPDFVQYANSYGARGHRVTRADELVPLIRKCEGSAGVDLIDVPIDYSDDDRLLNEDIKAMSLEL